MSEPIARIEAALRSLGQEHEPPAGWEERVLAAARKPAEPVVRSFYRQRWWLMFAPVLVVAGLLLWLVKPHGAPGSEDLAVNWRIDPRTSVRGIGSDGAVGDVAHAEVVGGRGYRVLRVYRRGVLIVDCSATPDGVVSQDAGPDVTCAVDHDKLEISLVLRATGSYRVLGLASANPLPASEHNFDLDQARAISAQLYRQSLVKSFEVE